MSKFFYLSLKSKQHSRAYLPGIIPFTSIRYCSHQSEFKPGDCCTNQLLSITHQIYKSFYDGHEVRSVFLDMSKALVWHKCLIFKLKKNGISGNLSSNLTDFLQLRKQIVVLNGQLSSWSNIESGVLQASILAYCCFWSI